MRLGANLKLQVILFKLNKFQIRKKLSQLFPKESLESLSCPLLRPLSKRKMKLQSQAPAMFGTLRPI